jgi:hypothetical protein
VRACVRGEGLEAAHVRRPVSTQQRQRLLFCTPPRPFVSLSRCVSVPGASRTADGACLPMPVCLRLYLGAFAFVPMPVSLSVYLRLCLCLYL